MPRSWRSHSLEGVTQSFIRRMTRECERVGGINLGQGVCDLPTPAVILRAAADAVLADESMYSPFEGRRELRQAIASKARDYNRLAPVDPDREVTVTIGATGAFHCAVQSLLDAGDEVLVFEPYYGYHVNTLQAGGLRPVFVPLTGPDWALDAARLEAAVTPRTRAILVNTPANPSGKVFSAAELGVIAALCQRHDLLALTDEIYEYIVYDRPHLSLAALPGMWERTVTISGFSKTYSITGWRLGYAIAPTALSERLGVANDLLYICAPTPLQLGVARGMSELGPEYYTDMAADYRRKRDRLCQALQRAGLTPRVPEGAYYVLAEAAALDPDDDVRAAMELLRRTGIAAVPGHSFYAHGSPGILLRFCFAKDWPVLEEACRRLEAAR
jgi:aminotransferase